MRKRGRERNREAVVNKNKNNIYNGKDAECAEGEERAEDETGEAVAEAGGTTCEE